MTYRDEVKLISCTDGTTVVLSPYCDVFREAAKAAGAKWTEVTGRGKGWNFASKALANKVVCDCFPKRPAPAPVTTPVIYAGQRDAKILASMVAGPSYQDRHRDGCGYPGCDGSGYCDNCS